VISDVRFPNEVNAINRIGGETWRICRDFDVLDTKHESEKELDRVDVSFNNNSTLEDLYELIDAHIDLHFSIIKIK
jgi:hypothetical protein